MAKIRVDIDELGDKIEAMKEDDYVTTELIIDSDGYSTELTINAVGFDEEEPVGYGTIPETLSEI